MKKSAKVTTESRVKVQWSNVLTITYYISHSSRLLVIIKMTYFHMFLLVMKDLQQNLVCCALIPCTMLLIKQILPSVTVFLYSRIVSYDF